MLDLWLPALVMNMIQTGSSGDLLNCNESRLEEYSRDTGSILDPCDDDAMDTERKFCTICTLDRDRGPHYRCQVLST